MNPSTATPSILGCLRAVTPTRHRISFEETLRIAELQATKLHELLGADTGIQESDIAALPRMAVRYEDLSVSGMSHWTGQQWVIVLNRGDSWARQRFTLCHEFKHIVDHGAAGRLYAGTPRYTPSQQAERAADFFAGCALVPRRQLKSLWGNGTQRLSDLAHHFGVSEDAMAVRLSQTGLSTVTDREPSPRCARRVVTTASGTNQRFGTVPRTSYASRSK